MNLFRLHNDPRLAAQMHCDKHVVKMILETAQMLSTAWRITESDSEYADEHGMYKLAHKNHPSTVWVRHTVSNYYWTINLFENLCQEYTHRYKKKHASERLLDAFKETSPTESWIIKDSMDFPQCMPDEYKVEDDPVQAYRKYYKAEKAYFAKWDRGRAAPEWWSHDD